MRHNVSIISNASSVLAVLIALLGYTPASSGQVFNAQMTGTVTDSSGGAVPSVKLTATSIATKTVYTATTNSEGLYRFPNLPPAEYRLDCAVAGFKTFQQGPITLQVNQTLEVNVKLEPGQASEQITVTAAPPPLDTETATLGQVVTTRSIQGLPLNVRDPFALVGLTPGVVFGANFGNGGGQDVGRNFFKSDFNVGGGRSGSQEILLDGAPDTTPDINRGVINPPVDSVQEFKVQANSFDAQFGRTSGGVINMVTKSGTNQLHGVLYDFERHSVLDANGFFNNRAGQKKLSFARHQFGANAGAPIWKNKWFIFGDYEGLRQGYPVSTLTTVPTALQRAGNFSQTLGSNGALIQIYDPNTLITLPDNSRQRTAFPGNIIPASRFDPVAVATLKLYPDANTTGVAVTGQNNYLYSTTSATNSDKYDIRSDVNFTQATRMLVRYSRQEDQRIVPGSLPLPIGGGRSTSDHYTQATADVTHVFSANTVGDVAFSFTRALAAQFGLSQGFNLASLGFPATYVSQVVSQVPVFNIGDVVGTSNGGDSFTQFQPRNVFATLGSVSWQHGKHSLKFGGDIRLLHFNEGQNASASGAFSFGRTFTQGPNPIQASNNGGYGLASFLLGAASSGSVTSINPISTQSLYYAAFVQDDWKVTSKLTINIGLRWDVGIGDREKYNRLAYFDPTAKNPLGAAAGLPNLTGLLQWVGQENPKNQQSTDWKNFGPRFGLAYSLDPKTVLRGGYGIFYLPRNVQGNGNGAVEAVRTTSMVASQDGVTPTNLISNPFPQGILPPLNDRDPLANTGASIAAPAYAFKNGYAQTWSAGIQREVFWGVVMDAHYWGGKSTHLLTSWNINQLPNQYLALGSALNDLVRNPFFGQGLGGVLASPTISRRQSLLPFPQYTAVTQVLVPAANSTYEAFTIQGEKRLSSSVTFLAAYTRSKGIDDVRTPLDYYNRSVEKGLSGFDTPNQFRLSGVYNLPFGHDRQYGKNLNRVVATVLGDWDISGIVGIQSGQPVSVGRPAVNNGTSAHLDNPSIYKWFDTTVFTAAPANTFGNVGPVLPDVRTDAQRNVDMVVTKNFSVNFKERKITAQFRSEFYNLFNHPQFAGPNGSVTSQTFGQVTAQANTTRDIQFGLKISF